MPDTNKQDRPTQVSLPQESDRPCRNPGALARLLDGWMQGDETEQRETFELLRQALDENRPVGYKLFS